MIPILYDYSEAAFTSNGLGRLSDCVSCVVTEERNGIYECEFKYPISGSMYSQITEGRIVGCTHDDKGDVQPFEIYGRSAPIDGIVTFYAHHISYRLRKIVLKPFAASSCADALSKFATETYMTNPFTFWTDKTVSAPYKIAAPVSVREMLSGVQGSILDVYGKGEYVFDKFAVKLYVNRGVDSGVSIKYGVNLVDLTHEVDVSDVYNAAIPYWLSAEGDTLVMLPEAILMGPHASVTPQQWTTQDGDVMTDGNGEIIYFQPPNVTAIPMDLSDAFEEQPTVAQLRATAQSRLNNSEAYLPDENIVVDFVALWQTADYAQYAAMQRLSLCDRVRVLYYELGVNATMQIVRTVYNVLTDRFDSMELGKARTTYAEAIAEQLNALVLPQYASRSMMTAAIQHATDMITGGLGGYVVFTLNADGQPEEILIMDTPDTATAVNVWRFNKNGLGHSHTGYSGPFDDIALTADGQINASMITSGTLLANVIKAGVLSDINNDNSWDLESGTLTFKRGSISFGETNGFYVGPYGDMAVGAKPADLSSFDGNMTGFQANVWGHTKMTELYFYGLPYGITDQYHRFARFYFEAYRDLDAHYQRALQISMYTDDATAAVVMRLMSTLAAFSVPVVFFNDVTLYSGANMTINGNLTVTGTKNRAVRTATHGTRKLYAYETASPYFGDIGEDVIGQDGRCVVEIDPVFAETIARGGYQVFVTPYGRGECFVAERGATSFTVEGNSGLRFGWEIKGRQIDYQDARLEDVQ